MVLVQLCMRRAVDEMLHYLAVNTSQITCLGWYHVLYSCLVLIFPLGVDLLSDLGLVSLNQPNLPHRTDVRIKWVWGESCKPLLGDGGIKRSHAPEYLTVTQISLFLLKECTQNICFHEFSHVARDACTKACFCVSRPCLDHTLAYLKHTMK